MKITDILPRLRRYDSVQSFINASLAFSGTISAKPSFSKLSPQTSEKSSSKWFLKSLASFWSLQPSPMPHCSQNVSPFHQSKLNIGKRNFIEYNVVSGDQHPEPIEVSVENCNEEYCIVKRKTVAQMEFTFKPTKQATELIGDVSARILGKWFDFKIGAAGKVCQNLVKGECPVEVNTEATYRLNLEVPFYAPVGKKLVQFRITDQTKHTVACVRFPIYITA